jgi:hypothetical protein
MAVPLILRSALVPAGEDAVAGILSVAGVHGIVFIIIDRPRN